MSARRWVPLGLGVTALLAVAGIASHGRPLASRRGSGPTAGFFDYVATTVAIAAALLLAVFVYLVLSHRWTAAGQPRGRWHLVTTMLMFAASLGIALLLLHSGFEQRLRKLEQQAASGQAAHPRQRLRAPPKDVRNARIRWDEVAVVAALLGGAAIVLVATRNARKTPRSWRSGRGEALAAALEESIDDLRTDPDLRRAIIAAYARMESALAHSGLPRRPSEAPFEYVERALAAGDTTEESLRRLTALFEWAKFSHHEPDATMRDDAVDALVSVRDELRARTQEQVPA